MADTKKISLDLKSKSKKRSKVDVRLIVQIIFFLLVAVISLNRFLVTKGMSIDFISTASLHSLCPFGGVVSIYTALDTGVLVRQVHQSSMVLMVIGLILALLVGPAFCGWACPLGSFQEWIGKIGKRLFKRRFNHILPIKIDRILRYFRYLVLIWVVYVTARSATLIFASYDPYFALFNFWSGEVVVSAFIILAFVFIISLIMERPFCKYACPYGALLGIFNLFRIFHIKRNPETCINCKKCDRTCPMNINVSGSGIVRNHQCISCLKCTSEFICPVNSTVDMRSFQFKTGVGQVNQNEN